MDVVIELPCDGMVKAYLEAQLPKCDSGYRISQTKVIGRMMLDLLDSKKTCVNRNYYDRKYTTSVMLVVTDNLYRRGRFDVDHRRVSDINALLRGQIREMAFNSCMSHLMMYPSANIRAYMSVWLEANGLLQNNVQLDNLLRTFFNWRKRHYPETLRNRGRYHNYKLGSKFSL